MKMTVRRLIKRYFVAIQPAAPTVRFLLIIGAMVCFLLALLDVTTVEVHRLENLGWFLLCATILFIDPENPPGAQQVGSEEHTTEVIVE